MKGKAWKYGDDVDTDVIIPARYLTTTAPDVLKAHCMEDIDKDFAGKVSPGDFIVAGNNFGCGSSREHAPLSIKAAGVSAVIARSFARIFFRNSFNIGLPILESAEAVDNIQPGDEIEVDLSSGTIRDLTQNREFKAQPVPEFMQQLIADGGLLPHVQKRIAAGEVKPPKPEPVAVESEEPEPPKEPGARMKEIEAEEDKGVAAPWGEDEASAPADEAAELEAGEAEEEEE